MTNNTSGEIFFDNIKVEKNSALKIRKIASFVFQNSDDQLFFPTVIEDVSFGAINSGLNEESANTLSRKLLSDFGIAHLENSQNQRLSDGEKKKVAICASLASDPKILLLDEPSALLDPKSKRECASFLSTLNKTILLSTHDLDFALNACPLSIVVNKGKLIAFGKTSEILTDKNLLLEASLV